MGEVYRATDLTLGQSVALKFLPEEAAQNQRLLERFHGEVRIARQVSHPNVCRVYDIGEAEGMPFISMEYVDGEDLASLLLRIGRLPADKALEIARKLCAGLAAAHDRGIIHRDLKPQNIMMNKRGDVVIMDFGLAAIADQLSGAEVRNGTPAYMAPEQLRGAEVTAKSDIYALGLVLYELFTGKRPFDANNGAGDAAPAGIGAIDQHDFHRRRHRSGSGESHPPLPRSRSGASVRRARCRWRRRCRAAIRWRRHWQPANYRRRNWWRRPANWKDSRPRYSIPCLIVIVVCLCAAVALRARYHRRDAHAARQSAGSAGAPGARDGVGVRISQEAGRFRDVDREPRCDLLDHLKQLPQPQHWDEWLASEAPIRAYYRESLSPLVADPYGEVTADNPAPTEPGMVHVVLDGSGRLREFQANPYTGCAGADASRRTRGRLPGRRARYGYVHRSSGSLRARRRFERGAFLERTASQDPWRQSYASMLASWKGRITQMSIHFEWPKTADGTAAQ